MEILRSGRHLAARPMCRIVLHESFAVNGIFSRTKLHYHPSIETYRICPSEEYPIGAMYEFPLTSIPCGVLGRGLRTARGRERSPDPEADKTTASVSTARPHDE